MLKRQKILLAILHEAKRPLSHVELVKTAFLLGQETPLAEQVAFYDFVPYRFGPFSFGLYRELSAIVRDGYVTESDSEVRLAGKTRKQTAAKINEVPQAWKRMIGDCVSKYLCASPDETLAHVYARYPWFSINSELTHLVSSEAKRPKAKVSIYTVGYEGKSVDGFFDGLLHSGIEIDITCT